MLVVSLETSFVPSEEIPPPSDSCAEPTLTEASRTAHGGQKKPALREVTLLHGALVPPCDAGVRVVFLPPGNIDNLDKDFPSWELSHWFYQTRSA